MCRTIIFLYFFSFDRPVQQYWQGKHCPKTLSESPFFYGPQDTDPFRLWFLFGDFSLVIPSLLGFLSFVFFRNAEMPAISCYSNSVIIGSLSLFPLCLSPFFRFIPWYTCHLLYSEGYLRDLGAFRKRWTPPQLMQWGRSLLLVKSVGLHNE